MNTKDPLRRVLLSLLILAVLAFLGFYPRDDARATRWATIVIAAVTAVYALTTYEILRQNKLMADAAMETTRIMERSLRFSFAPNLLFSTLVTKDPTLSKYAGYSPHKNADFARAMQEFVGSGQQTEFVFAVVRNVGRGPGTKLTLQASYNIRDTANANYQYAVVRDASMPLLEADRAVCLLVYVSKVPTADDRVQLVSATIFASDSYRDAQNESAVEVGVDILKHVVEKEQTCILPVV